MSRRGSVAEMLVPGDDHAYGAKRATFEGSGSWLSV
jgi:hypothetical protein